MMSGHKNLSRRNFLLAGAGVITGGALITSKSKIFKSINKLRNGEAAQAGQWVYPSQGLDVDLVRQYGKESYTDGGCGYAGAYALVQALKDTLGEGSIWDSLPVDMFRYGTGGANGWGTLCGALNGSLAISTLACPIWKTLADELMGWYTVTPLPTEVWKPQVQSVSNSPLCHVSISIWAKDSGKTVDSPEKAERCSSLVGDTAAKAAELLNEYAATGNIIPKFVVPKEYGFCLDCHTLTKNEVGKMNCTSCHDPDEHWEK